MEADELLTIKVTTIVPAPPEVLRERLAERLAECDRRAAKYKGWAGTVSGKWLLDDIAKLEAALSLPSNIAVNQTAENTLSVSSAAYRGGWLPKR